MQRRALNRNFNPYPRRLRFDDAGAQAVPTPVITSCSHPFGAMKIAGWTVSRTGRTLVVDAICAACGVRYAKIAASAPEEYSTDGITVPGENLLPKIK